LVACGRMKMLAVDRVVDYGMFKDNLETASATFCQPIFNPRQYNTCHVGVSYGHPIVKALWLRKRRFLVLVVSLQRLHKTMG